MADSLKDSFVPENAGDARMSKEDLFSLYRHEVVEAYKVCCNFDVAVELACVPEDVKDALKDDSELLRDINHLRVLNMNTYKRSLEELINGEKTSDLTKLKAIVQYGKLVAPELMDDVSVGGGDSKVIITLPSNGRDNVT